jgi:hypothetical protein
MVLLPPEEKEKDSNYRGKRPTILWGQGNT